MDSLTLAQISVNHLEIYEDLYRQVDPKSTNYINAIEAANFLKKSGLSQATLGKIWDLSDPNCKGYLDKKSLFVALKLIALVQNGRQPSITDLTLNILPPKMGDSIDWSVNTNDRQKYTDLFNSHKPIDGKLPGSVVKPIMIASKLPVDILTKIWDLSDTDEDGLLDISEFIIAMHLVAKATAKIPMPSVLPIELLSLKRPENRPEMWSAFDSTSQLLSNRVTSPVNTNKSGLNTWVVNATDKAKYDELFQTLDTDLDGYVGGGDVKGTLVQSGLPTNILAHIWNLCDLKENGKLNSEQFALAMHFIKQKQIGLELPQVLSPEMIPPTLRPKPIGIDNINALDSKSQSLNTNGKSNIPSLQSTGNKELDDLAEELKDLQIEKLKLETELNSDEAAIKLKESEVKNLQNEIETLHQMLKQLDSQKCEARKRLDDLGSQSKLLEKNLHELNNINMDEKLKVENLSQQLNEQKVKVETQEKELTFKRKELEDLKSEELKLESHLESFRKESQLAAKTAGDTQLEISQIRTKIVELEEYERRVNDSINDMDSALSSQDIIKISNLLPRTLTPPLIESESQNYNQNGFNAFQNESDIKGNISEFSNDPFAGEDPFKAEDPFKSDNRSDDPFTSSGFANFGPQEASKEVFDPFGTGSFTGTPNKSDPFGSDPFASQVNTNVRSESPTPELPPKKSKAPPPRPAPPKNISKTPLRSAPAPPGQSSDSTIKSDPFSSSQQYFDPFNDNNNKQTDAFGSSTNFANFANFDKHF
ncbi:epidermal growth factor receptor substrate 15-like 1 [Oppia nitens]|uniref:epidermal growth factor receptor substrate 15-like 1 n=1 Tax=Oppia nitens TaxID=1686743 RepID=UPI0023DAADB0|nr:epidermal growth factor receptor substrate 15-like 1 [Oppia nitens]